MFSQKVNPSKFIQQYTRSIYAASLRTYFHVRKTCNKVLSCCIEHVTQWRLQFILSCICTSSFTGTHALWWGHSYIEVCWNFSYKDCQPANSHRAWGVSANYTFVSWIVCTCRKPCHTYVRILFRSNPFHQNSLFHMYVLLSSTRTVYCSELVGQKWTKRNKRDFAPGICCFIERFNLVRTMVLYDNPPSMYCAYARYT